MPFCAASCSAAVMAPSICGVQGRWERLKLEDYACSGYYLRLMAMLGLETGGPKRTKQRGSSTPQHCKQRKFGLGVGVQGATGRVMLPRWSILMTTAQSIAHRALLWPSGGRLTCSPSAACCSGMGTAMSIPDWERPCRVREAESIDAALRAGQAGGCLSALQSIDKRDREC